MRWDELLAHAIDTVLLAPLRPSPPESTASSSGSINSFDSLGSNAPAYTNEGADWNRPLPATPPPPPAPSPAELEPDDAGQMLSGGSAQVEVALGPQEETSPVQRGEQADVAALLRLLLPDTPDFPDDAAPAHTGVLSLYESASSPALDPRSVHNSPPSPAIMVARLLRFKVSPAPTSSLTTCSHSTGCSSCSLRGVGRTSRTRAPRGVEDPRCSALLPSPVKPPRILRRAQSRTQVHPSHPASIT